MTTQKEVFNIDDTFAERMQKQTNKNIAKTIIKKLIFDNVAIDNRLEFYCDSLIELIKDYEASKSKHFKD